MIPLSFLIPSTSGRAAVTYRVFRSITAAIDDKQIRRALCLLMPTIILVSTNEATILNGALTFVFPDLFAEGNVGGIIIGIPPIFTDHDNSNLIDKSTSWHLEAIYRISVSDNIAITPGIFLITNPNHEDRSPIWVGNIRTRFSF